MSDVNPYDSPETSSELAPGTAKNANLRSVRVIFCIHLLAVMICAMLSLLDTRQITLPPAVQQVVGPILYVVVLPAIFSWIVCPITMLIAASRLKERSIWFRMVIVAADGGLSAFQLWTLLPGVQ